ncbi:amidase [Pseudoalteromonas sp. NBT06-2]|uniref:amidase n=1 Tax=Pseudoalteromonas sp. NBT06-2 TaxID=2025950 RepID=UPI000BA6582F|nr:amidase [Pseudoalteromonas sp. NBT06-2]PAJ72078.1 amidase [Pseudoalteromonas sp. NBT06-2]
MYLKRIIIPILLAYSFSSNAKIDDDMNITQIHQKMQQKKLTSQELVLFYLNRISKYDDNGIKLNAVVQINEKALLQAKDLDDYYIKHGKKGPLHGIPILLKDNIDTADGMANTAGSYALANNYPSKNAFLVEKLIEDGAIILGKTNLSEWANFRSTSASSGWSGLYGQSKNPYDPTTNPCGSSSGSGIAIAANFATLAIGTETDGSVTCPSAVNGVVGFKPTIGTISRQGIIPISHSQDTAGTMTRSVTDAVIMLNTLVAKDESDTGSIASNIDYLSHLKIKGLKGKRIGIARNLMGYHKKLDRIFERAVADLSAQGAIIIDNANIETYGQWNGPEFEVLLYEFKHGLNAYLKKTQGDSPKSLEALIAYNLEHKTKEMPYFEQELFEMAQAKGELTDKQYLDALTNSKLLTQEKGIDLVLNKHNLDLIIAPTSQPAWKTDWITGDHFLGSAASAAAVSGYPHITVPMGYVHGLPVGISMFGAKLSEGTLIEAAYGFEQATLHRQPPKL